MNKQTTRQKLKPNPNHLTTAGTPPPSLSKHPGIAINRDCGSFVYSHRILEQKATANSKQQQQHTTMTTELPPPSSAAAIQTTQDGSSNEYETPAKTAAAAAEPPPLPNRYYSGAIIMQGSTNDDDYFPHVIDHTLQAQIDVIDGTLLNGLAGNSLNEAEDAIDAVIAEIDGNVNARKHADFVDGILHCPNGTNGKLVGFLGRLFQNFHAGNNEPEANQIGEKLIKLLRLTSKTDKEGRNKMQSLLLMKTFSEEDPFHSLLNSQRGENNFVVFDAAMFLLELISSVNTGNEGALFGSKHILPNGASPTIDLNPLKLLINTFTTVLTIVDTMTLNGKIDWLIETNDGQNGHHVLSSLLYDTYLPLSNRDADRRDLTDQLSTANAEFVTSVMAIVSIVYSQA